MGPRSGERGNTLPLELSVLSQASLQWGLVQVNVETNYNLTHQTAHRLLQWGHVQVNVETKAVPPFRSATHLASMGPRSGERGNASITS